MYEYVSVSTLDTVQDIFGQHLAFLNDGMRREINIPHLKGPKCKTCGNAVFHKTLNAIFRMSKLAFESTIVSITP